MNPSHREPDWHRSSFCDSNTCVEVARVGDMILIRDSRDPQGTVLRVTIADWKAFLAGVYAREFDAD